jgi:hypothetical protein
VLLLERAPSSLGLAAALLARLLVGDGAVLQDIAADDEAVEGRAGERETLAAGELWALGYGALAPARAACAGLHLTAQGPLSTLVHSSTSIRAASISTIASLNTAAQITSQNAMSI